MLDCLRTHRTTLELNAGLREKISAMRDAINLADKLQKEIKATIKEKDLDLQMLWRDESIYLPMGIVC